MSAPTEILEASRYLERLLIALVPGLTSQRREEVGFAVEMLITLHEAWENWDALTPAERADVEASARKVVAHRVQPRATQ